MPPAPAHPLSPPSAVVRLTPKAVVQLLVRNRHTQFLPTPRHRLPYRPKPPLQYRLRHPPLPRPYFWPHSLICASMPSASYHFTHRYAHALLLPPPSSASTATLVSTSMAPAISWLSEPLPPTCKAGKTLLLDASKLSSMAVPYLLSFGWGHKNASHKKWYKLSMNPLPPPSPYPP